MKKNYIGICLDSSGSMNSIRRATVKAYNANIAGIRTASDRENQDTIMYSNAFGGEVRWLFRNSSVKVLKDLDEKSYSPSGGTPLFRALKDMVEELKRVPDYNDPEVAFQILVVTDGEENTSGAVVIEHVKQMMKELNKTDRWTFAFLVPDGTARDFVRNYNVPEGNVSEWSTTERGAEEAFKRTSQAYSNYFTKRTAGTNATNTFYSDLTNVTVAEVKANLKDISREVELLPVKNEAVIRDLVEKETRKPFLKGAAFYELVKTEKKVQDYKQIAIRNKKTGEVYAGAGARHLLGLPTSGDVKLVPGNHGQYDVFVQSTSVNRKLPAGTRVLYWPAIGVPYVEGVSAPWGR